MAAVFKATLDWRHAISRGPVRRLPCESLKLRVGVHAGILHMMKHTMMGRDIEIARTLAALGAEGEIVLSGPAVEAMRSENLAPASMRSADVADMRECGSKRRWLARYASMLLFRLNYGDLEGIV